MEEIIGVTCGENPPGRIPSLAEKSEGTSNQHQNIGPDTKHSMIPFFDVAGMGCDEVKLPTCSREKDVNSTPLDVFITPSSPVSTDAGIKIMNKRKGRWKKSKKERLGKSKRNHAEYLRKTTAELFEEPALVPVPAFDVSEVDVASISTFSVSGTARHLAKEVRPVNITVITSSLPLFFCCCCQARSS